MRRFAIFMLFLTIFSCFERISEHSWKKTTVFVWLTGYSSRRCETDDTPFITASNKRVRDGIVACNFLPFGTQIKIPDVFGNKIFTVEDRMARRHKNNVDVWFASTKHAKKMGRKKVAIEIVQSGKN